MPGKPGPHVTTGCFVHLDHFAAQPRLQFLRARDRAGSRCRNIELSSYISYYGERVCSGGVFFFSAGFGCAGCRSVPPRLPFLTAGKSGWPPTWTSVSTVGFGLAFTPSRPVQPMFRPSPLIRPDRDAPPCDSWATPPRRTLHYFTGPSTASSTSPTSSSIAVLTN